MHYSNEGCMLMMIYTRDRAARMNSIVGFSDI